LDTKRVEEQQEEIRGRRLGTTTIVNSHMMNVMMATTGLMSSNLNGFSTMRAYIGLFSD